MSEGCLELFWGVTRELSGDVKGMSEGCLDDVWVVSGGLCRVSGRYLQGDLGLSEELFREEFA